MTTILPPVTHEDLLAEVWNTVAILQARIDLTLERVDTILNKDHYVSPLQCCRLLRRDITAEEVTEKGVDMHQCLPMLNIPNGPGLGITQIEVGGLWVQRSHILLYNKDHRLSSPGYEVLPRNQETTCRLSLLGMSWITCFCNAAENPDTLEAMLEGEITRLKSAD